MVFRDLTKAFDSVSRPGLWMILAKIGCSQKFINIIHSFHDGMMGHVVIDGGEASTAFAITNGTKQRCVLAALLFSIFFAMMLMVAFKDCDSRVSGSLPHRWQCLQPPQITGSHEDLRCHNQGLAVCRRLRLARSLRGRSPATVHSLLYSGNSLRPYRQPEKDRGHAATMQHVMSSYSTPKVTAGDIELVATNKFCYLGSILSSDSLADQRHQRASSEG